jgi:uncharacterized protein (TIGR02001 family)
MLDLSPPNPALQVVVATIGMSKGEAQTTGPQVVATGGLDFGVFSLGAYGKNVHSGNGEVVEAGASIGIQRTVAGFQLHASAQGEQRIGRAAVANTTALELQAGAARTFGPLTATATVIYSPNDLGATGRSVYGEAGLKWQLRKGTVLSGSVGRREVKASPDYSAWSLGVTQSIGRHIQLDLRWYDTNKSQLGQPYRSRFVAALKTSF